MRCITVALQALDPAQRLCLRNKKEGRACMEMRLALLAPCVSVHACVEKEGASKVSPILVDIKVKIIVDY